MDRELHMAYASRDEHVTTESLHGHQQLQWRLDAISSLERERNVLLAREVAVETVDDILSWMLEGWYFGERVSKMKVMGFVPSLKKDGPLRTDEVRKFMEKGHKEREISVSEMISGNVEDRWGIVGKEADLTRQRIKAVRVGTDTHHALNETENTLRFGLFCLTLMYFRSMTLLGREKDTWSGKNDVMMEHEAMGRKEESEERMKMLEERRLRDVRRR